NRAYIDAEAEAIHLILTRIRDDIYSTVDACTTAKEIWISIERLQQGESLNKQDAKTNLFWEFGKFTLRDRESIESYNLSFYKMMNEMQNIDLDKESYHKLFDILKQYQIEVNEICAEKLAKNANPLALVTSSSISHAPTRTKGKEIAKPVTPASESASDEDKSGPTFDAEPLEKVQSDDDYNVFANERQHFDKPNSINNIYVVEKVDSNVILDLSDMCDNDGKDDQNIKEYEDERVCKSALIEPNDVRDRCRSALHQKEVELEKYKTYKNCQLEKVEIERKYKETLDLLAQHKHQSNEALKTQAYETFQFKEKNTELTHQGSLKHIRYDLLRKEKEQLQKDFKISQDKDIDKIIALENQIKFLNNVVYKTNQSVQTIHMIAPNLSSYYNGRASFVNPLYLKKAQSEKPCLYQVPYDQDDLANIFAPNSAETLILEKESRLKLNKDKVKPYDYTYQKSLYELFTP
ncbi:hypothetical protein Tco_1253447, partial [Tanacetum coccineum]